jgi:hypothetical protein
MELVEVKERIMAEEKRHFEMAKLFAYQVLTSNKTEKKHKMASFLREDGITTGIMIALDFVDCIREQKNDMPTESTPQ